MEHDRVQRYVTSLERTIKNDYLHLKETLDSFQELCRMVTPERSVPQGIIVDIREMYKEIRTRLTEIKAVQQLLQGKYRQYHRRDSMMEKEILEFGYIAKNVFSKFEYTLIQKQAKDRLKAIGRGETPLEEDSEFPFQWFHSKENQIALAKNLRLLKELEYEQPSESKNGERRDLSDDRSLTLFLLSGNPSSLDQLLSEIRFREHDLVERFRPNEIRGALTHLKKVPTSQVEGVFQRMLKERGFLNLKGLLLPVRFQRDFKGIALTRLEAILIEMKEGEVRTLEISKKSGNL